MATIEQPRATGQPGRPTSAQAYGVQSAESAVAPMTIERRALRPALRAVARLDLDIVIAQPT